MPDPLPSRIVASIAFVGQSSGPVKALAGFKKGRHRLPDTANAITNAFLGRICEAELSEEAERLFQATRTGLGYKRKDITLSVASPLATLTAKSFAVEMLYALEDGDAARYAVTTTMRELTDAALARREEFSRIFAGRFSRISFDLKKAARVEAVIDAIEALDGEGGLRVRYPSDYRDCVIVVESVDAEVRCTSATLEVVFPRGGAPVELIDAFAAVREAFQISRVLHGLIG